MKKNILSLIMGATLVLPTLAMAMPMSNSNVMSADMQNASVESTVQAEVEGPDGELLATQPGAVDIDESDDIQMDDDAADMNDEASDMDDEAGDMDMNSEDVNSEQL